MMAYFEMFALSVAHMSRLSTAFVPRYDRDGSFSCCSGEALKGMDQFPILGYPTGGGVEDLCCFIPLRVVTGMMNYL